MSHAAAIWRRATCGLASLLLTACAATPSLSPPAVALPDAWRAPLPHGGSTTSLVDWWRTFPDPMLAQLIERAQLANPTLQAAAARHRQAAALASEARAGQQPRVDASMGVNRGKSLNNVPGMSTQTESQLSASWDPDPWGGKRAEAAEQLARAQAAGADWHEARVALAADVAGSYINLRLAQAREEVAGIDATLAGQLADWGRAQQAVGLLDASEVARLTGEAAQAESRRNALHAEAQLALQTLAVLLATPAEVLAAGLEPPAVSPSAMQPVRMLPEVAGFAMEAVPLQLMAQRPDLAAAHQRWLAAVAHWQAVDAQRYPQLSLGAMLGETRLRIDGGGVASTLWSIGPSLTLPLFDGGAARARSKAAQAEIDEAAAMLQSAWHGAVAEVEEALERLAVARNQLRIAESTARDRQQMAHRAEAQFRAGLYGGPQRVGVRRSALAAHDEWLQAQAEHAHGWFRLYRSLGGGWQAAAAIPDQLVAQP